MKSVPCELFHLGYVMLQMAQRKEWDPERIKAAIVPLSEAALEVLFLEYL
jgi:hypothetical protein